MQRAGGCTELAEHEGADGGTPALLVPGASLDTSLQVVVDKRARISWVSLVRIPCTSPRRVKDEKAGECDGSPDNL